MPDFLSQLSAFTVFLGIGGFGFLFLLFSLAFGELFEHFDGGDHDFDHGGPSFFSSRILSVFVTAFGGFGAVASHYGMTIGPASGVGFDSGAVFASLIYYFARFLYGQQATTQVQSQDMVGRAARVIVSIPNNGIGQVRCQVGDEMIDKIAKTKDGSPVSENATVRIEEVLGEVVVVRQEES
jgi:membrane protein implicated in regulation of membrane protease activity